MSEGCDGDTCHPQEVEEPSNVNGATDILPMNTDVATTSEEAGLKP